MKAVIYARYSSDSQREESIEGQLRECTAFAEKNGITVLRHYIDRAYSAKTDNRPEFQNMIKDSGKRLFDIVIVWKLDRFARNRYDSARYKATLKKNGVKVVSATEIISEGAEGIILESVLEGYAEYYSADLSEKVIRGMTDNALKCKFNGGMMPIGYVIDAEQHFRIDPLTAPFVLEAFKRYDGGETISSIMNWLNEQGLTNTRGQKMTFNSVGHILHNRRYIGEFRYRDVIVPDGIPAIVPQALFDRVQEKLAKNKKAPARHKAEDDYLLTTKLFCGCCGAYLCGESGTSRTGKVHHYYKCVSVKKKRTECHKRPVRKEWIEDLVVGETMKMVMDDKAIEAIVSMLMDLQDRENVNVPLYEQQLREADTAISNLLGAIQQGILTRSTKARLEELENRRDELENRLACEKLAKPKVSAEFMTFWLHRVRKLDVRQQIHRKMLIDTFINAIFLYDDKMVITFNYKEGTKTITFAELQEAISDKNGSDLDCLAAPSNKPAVSQEAAGLFSVLCFVPDRFFLRCPALRGGIVGLPVNRLVAVHHLIRFGHRILHIIGGGIIMHIADGNKRQSRFLLPLCSQRLKKAGVHSLHPVLLPFQQHAELVSAIAEAFAAPGILLADGASDGAQHHIAKSVSVGVVNQLETVHIEEDDDAFFVHMGNAVVIAPPVNQFRQIVGLVNHFQCEDIQHDGGNGQRKIHGPQIAVIQLQDDAHQHQRHQ